MAEGSITTVQQLFTGITEGKVPRQVRLFAAQGMLPVPREDLLRLQFLLSADPDEELAEVARASIKNEADLTLVDWIREYELEALVLDLVIRVRDEETVWAAVAVAPTVSDETLRVLARHGTPLVQDIVVTNQVRVMSCLEILDDLKANPQVSPVVLRRIKEFEEEFIEKALALEGALEQEGIHSVSIEEALGALREIGAHIPREAAMPYPVTEDPQIAELLAKQEGPLHTRLADMTVREMVMCALKGTREERGVLINSRNRLVVHAVLASPKLGENEVERFANSRSVSEEVLRVISSNNKWLRLYGVVLAVVQNPKAQLQTALRLLPKLNSRDLMRVSRNRNVPPVVRRRAGDLHSKRR
jgi:hypothetical protein